MRLAEQRPVAPGDQEKIEKCYRILYEHFSSPGDCQPIHWIGACVSILVDANKASGVTYEQFCQEIDRIKGYYLHWQAPPCK